MSLFKTALIGILFGLSLHASPVWTRRQVALPVTRQVGDVDFRSSSVLTFYLLTIAVTTLSVQILNATGHTNIKPRDPSTYGYFKYDGNVVGGLMLGLGMAVSKSEPNLELVKAGFGVCNAWFGVLGAVLAGLVFVTLNDDLKRSPTLQGKRGEGLPAGIGHTTMNTAGTRATETRVQSSASSKTLSIPELIGLTRWSFVLLEQIVLIAMITALNQDITQAAFQSVSSEQERAGETTSAFALVRAFVATSTSRLVNSPPSISAAAVATSQLLSLLLRNSLIGVTGVYPDIANHLTHLLTKPDTADQANANTSPSPRPSPNTLIFALSMILSGYISSLYSNEWHSSSAQCSETLQPDSGQQMASLIGGFVTVFGARVAGGCTSGHLLSGITTLGASSFVVLGATIAGFVVADHTFGPS